MTDQYVDKIVLISGTTRGIGKGIAEHFLNHGATVLGLSRSPGTISGAKYHHFPTDIGDEESVQGTFGLIRKQFSRIDVLVNNAGVATFQLSTLAGGKAADEMWRTNFFGAFLLSREGAKLMMPQKYGRVVHISSMAVPVAPPGSALYSATKSALTQFSRVFSKEMSGHGITSNVLGISAVETELWNHISQEKLKKLVSELPVPRAATLEDVAHVVDFLVHPASGNITGQVLYLNGVS